MATDTEALLLKIDATTEGLRRELRRAEREVGTGSRRMEQHIGRLDRSMDRLNRTARQLRTALGSLGVGVSLRGLQNLATSSLRAADALANTSDRVGVAVEALQELRYTANQFGIASNVVDMAMQRLTRRLGEAAAGGGALRQVLEANNIAVRDAEGRVRATEDVLADLADTIAATESPAEQLRLAFAAFDSEGSALVNVLRQGSQGLRRWAGDARAAGRVMDQDLVRQASRLNTQFDNLFATIRTQVQEGLLRTLTGDMEDLSGVARDPSFHSGLQAIGGAIGFIGQNVTGMIGDFGRLVELFSNPSVQGLLDFGGRFLDRATFGLISYDDALERQHRNAVQRLNELDRRLERQRSEGAAAAHIEATERDIERTLRLINDLEERLTSRPLEVEINRGTVVNMPPSRSAASAPAVAPAVDEGAQAALAAMQQAAAVRDAHAESVGQLLASLQQEADMNGLVLQYMRDQNGELETQQRLLEIRWQLGQEVADQAEPMLRHIQQQTAAIERQQSAYDFLDRAAGRAFDRIGGAMTEMFMGGENAALTWANTVNAVISEIMQSMLQLAVINPLKNALLGGNAATLDDMGGIMGNLFHSGGIVGGTAARRMVNPLVFAGAPRMHSGGLAGYEVPAILKRGEEVLTTADPRHRRNQAEPAQNITINISAPGGDPELIRRSMGRAASELARVVARGQRYQ